VQELQKFYLSKFSPLCFNLGFPDCFQYGKNLDKEFGIQDCYMVSNYALSEMGEVNRNQYLENVFKRYSTAGFVVWNNTVFSPVFVTEPGSTTWHQVSEEVPQTGPHNLVVQWRKKAMPPPPPIVDNSQACD
jgi:hypothetical protein